MVKTIKIRLKNFLTKNQKKNNLAETKIKKKIVLKTLFKKKKIISCDMVHNFVYPMHVCVHAYALFLFQF